MDSLETNLLNSLLSLNTGFALIICIILVVSNVSGKQWRHSKVKSTELLVFCQSYKCLLQLFNKPGCLAQSYSL